MTTVIYHGDCDDGFGAALAAWLHFGDKATYTPGFYGEEPPDVVGQDVFILDFSYPREVMEELGEAAQMIILLDHHKSAALALADLTLRCDALVSFDMERSGARMAWEHFHPGAKLPQLIKHIEDNDLWRFNFFETRNIIRNLRSYPHDFKVWNEIMIDLEDEYAGYPDFVAEGAAQERFFQNQLDFLLLNTKPQPVFLGEHRGLMINAPRMFVSDVGHRLAEESGTFGMAYNIQGDGKVACSLRSIGGFDVSLIAKLFRGGGHRNAAGFETTKEVLMMFLDPKVDDPFGSFTD